MDNLAKLYFNKVKIVIRGRMYKRRQIRVIKVFLRPIILKSSLKVAFMPENGYHRIVICYIFFI